MAGYISRVSHNAKHFNPRFFLIGAILLIGFASLLSCSSLPQQAGGPSQSAAQRQEQQSERDARVARLEVLPREVTVRLGQKIHFTTIAYDEKDVPVGGVNVSWGAHDSRGGAIPISPTGEFYAQSSGVVNVTAEVLGHRAETTVKVAEGTLPNLQQRPTRVIEVDSRELRRPPLWLRDDHGT